MKNSLPEYLLKRDRLRYQQERRDERLLKEEVTMICPQCGCNIELDAQECRFCSANISGLEIQEKAKEQEAAKEKKKRKFFWIK